MRHRLEQRYLSVKENNKLRKARIASGNTSEPYVKGTEPKMTKAQKKIYKKAMSRIRYGRKTKDGSNHSERK